MKGLQEKHISRKENKDKNYIQVKKKKAKKLYNYQYDDTVDEK